MRRTSFPLLFLAAALVLPLAAHADIIDFTLTGEGNTITFPFHGATIPGEYFPRGHEVSSMDLIDVVNGVATNNNLYFFDWPPPGPDAIVEIYGLPHEPSGALVLYGPILLNNFGTLDTLILGTFDLTAADGAPYLLTVGPESSSAPVPESGTWALFATGALGIFYLGRRSRVVRLSPGQKSLTPLIKL